jgi:hypothetical protein
LSGFAAGCGAQVGYSFASLRGKKLSGQSSRCVLNPKRAVIETGQTAHIGWLG